MSAITEEPCWACGGRGMQQHRACVECGGTGKRIDRSDERAGEFLPPTQEQTIAYLEDEVQRTRAEARELEDAAIAQGFADCEALVAAGLLALAEKEDEKANRARRESEEAYRTYQEAAAAEPSRYPANLWQRWKDGEAARDFHDHRAACLRELAVSLGQFRTAECNERAIVAAHREAAGFHSGSRGGHARAAKLSPERRKEIAQLAARARWAAKKGE